MDEYAELSAQCAAAFDRNIEGAIAMDELAQLKRCIERNTAGMDAGCPMTACDWVDMLGQLARAEIEKAETVVVVKREGLLYMLYSPPVHDEADMLVCGIFWSLEEAKRAATRYGKGMHIDEWDKERNIAEWVESGGKWKVAE